MSIALKKKDISLVKKITAPDFSISTYSGPGAYSLLDIILKNQNFESIEFISENNQTEKDPAIILATAKFVMQNNKVYESIIAFDPNTRIVFIDRFDNLFGHSRYRESRLIGTIPFTESDESIILQLSLNGVSRPLLFLLDTGADGMAIRKGLADSLNLKINHVQTANVVGGKQQVEISSGNTVCLSDSITLTNQNIAIFEHVRNNTDGIIGLNLIKQFITQIDFDKKLIHFYSFGGDIKHTDSGRTIRVSMPNGLIMVSGVLNLTGKKEVAGNFVVDTGANYHLIAFSRFVRKNRLLLSGFKPESEGATTSLGHTTPVYYGKAAEFDLENGIIQTDMPVTLQASGSRESTDINTPDGSIGIQFFNKYNITINLLEREIHLVPRKLP